MQRKQAIQENQTENKREDGKDEGHDRDDKEKSSRKAQWTHISSCVSGLLAVDCKEVWFNPEWEDTILRSENWLHEVKKKDEEKKMWVGASKVGQSYDPKC